MPKKDSQFKKGQSGNPSGRPKLPEEVRKARDLTSQEFIKIASEFLAMDRQAIQVRLQDPKTSMLELIVGGIVAKSAKDHDHLRANFLLDRTIGKVKEQFEVTMPKPTIITRPNGEQVILGSQLDEGTEE